MKRKRKRGTGLAPKASRSAARSRYAVIDDLGELSVVKEHPILFSAPMVRAILAGTKTQTRRIATEKRRFRANPGERLWVRETFAYLTGAGRRIVYRATEPEPEQLYYPGEKVPMTWTPSIFMRRSESRITLEVTDVRSQRLQDISGYDAIAEGIGIPRCDCEVCRRTSERCPADWSAAVLEFAGLWDSINGKRPCCSWLDNPVVA